MNKKKPSEKEIPNATTRETLDELEEMKNDDEKYKRHSSFSEILEEVWFFNHLLLKTQHSREREKLHEKAIYLLQLYW